MTTKTSRKVLAIAFLTMAVVLAATSAAAGATPLGSGDWAFSTTLRVSENSGTTLHEYPILVNLSGENFPTEAKTDGGDLRFSFAGQELNYWLEEFDGVEKRGAVWVRVPVLPAGESVFAFGDADNLDAAVLKLGDDGAGFGEVAAEPVELVE